MSLLQRSVTGLVPLDERVQVLAPVETDNPNFPCSTYLEWEGATVAATLKGRLAPASTRALERTGRVGKVGVHELFTTPSAQITPLGRVRIGARVFQVLDARAYRQRTHAIVEEVSA